MTRVCALPTCAAPRHGDFNAYTHHGCRCPAAREAKRLHAKRWRTGRLPSLVPAVGAIRRIHALHAIGWRSQDIAAHTGLQATNVRRMTSSRGSGDITPDTHARIVAAYRKLSGTDGPSDRTRRRARRAGWARPIDWDDDAIDDPAATPHIDPAPPRAPAVAKYLGDLTAGLKVNEIAKRYEVQVDSVEQALRRHREREAS